MIKAPSIWLLYDISNDVMNLWRKMRPFSVHVVINWAKSEAAVHTVGRISDLLLGIRQTSVRILAQLCVPWQTDAALDFSVYLFSPVTQSCPTLGDPMDCSTPGFPVYHQLLELAQTHVHQVGDAIQPSHPLSSISPSAFLSVHRSNKLNVQVYL